MSGAVSNRALSPSKVRELFYLQLCLLSFPSVVTGIISLSLHSKTNTTWKIQSHSLLIPKVNSPKQAKPKRKSHHKTVFHNPLNIPFPGTISASPFAASRQSVTYLPTHVMYKRVFWEILIFSLVFFQVEISKWVLPCRVGSCSWSA